MQIIEGIHLTPNQVRDHLGANGYFRHLPISDWSRIDRESIELHDALRSYQGFHGELPDGVFGPKTEGRMLAPRCGLPDHAFDEAAGLPAWPASCRKIPTSHRLGALKPMETEREHAAWLAGLAEINLHSGYELFYVTEMQDAKIYANPGRMGRGTLAWSYLPNGSCAERLEQQYNATTSWTWDLFIDTLVHELLHALGLGHGPAGSIMAPTADGSFGGRLDAWSIAELVKRAGPKLTPPAPVPIPPQADSAVAMFEVGGVKYGGSIPRI